MAQVQYQQRLKEYLPRYGVAMRTLKQWIQIGRAAGDPCPLDRPGDMPAWWQRNRRHSVPPKLWEAAGWMASGQVEGQALPGMPTVPPQGMVPPPMPPGLVRVPMPPAPPAPSAFADGEGAEVDSAAVVDFVPGMNDNGQLPQGLDEEVERLELLAARLSVQAEQPGRTKPYLDTVGRLTTLTAKLREEAVRRRALIPRDEAEQMIHEMHGPLEREVRLLLDPMAKVLGVAITPEFRKRWDAECDQLCGRLQEQVFR